MASQKSKKVYRCIFENTFKNTKYTFQEIGKRAGYCNNGLSISTWLPSNCDAVISTSDIWKLTPKGAFFILYDIKDKKNYSKDELDILLKYAETIKEIIINPEDVFVSNNVDHMFFEKVVFIDRKSDHIGTKEYTIPVKEYAGDKIHKREIYSDDEELSYIKKLSDMEYYPDKKADINIFNNFILKNTNKKLSINEYNKIWNKIKKYYVNLNEPGDEI